MDIDDFKNKIYKEDYIQNGIRVMKKYLFPSLENQSCKNFIWILKLGDKANITYIKSLLNFTTVFEKDVIYQNDIRNYTRKITKGYDILITTRIDCDDRLYYDSVHDVIKAINIDKPMALYGYNRGAYYFESDNSYYDVTQEYKNQGSIFASLIAILSKVNDTYNIFDLGTQQIIKFLPEFPNSRFIPNLREYSRTRELFHKKNSRKIPDSGIILENNNIIIK